MPKVPWAIDTEEPTGDGRYAGPLPKDGVYTVKLKRLSMKINSKGNQMISGLVEITEPKDSDKAKYNGYGIWFNQSIADNSKPFVKRFLDSFGITWADFISKTILESDDLPSDITRLGMVKVDSQPTCRIQGKVDREYDPENPKLVADRWLPKPLEVEDDTDDDDDDAPVAAKPKKAKEDVF